MRATRVSKICVFFLLSSAIALAQRGDVFNDPGATTTTVSGYESRGGGTILMLTVYAGNNKTLMDRQSVVKLSNVTTKTVNWQTTGDGSVASFGDLQFGHYDIEVSAVGYLTEHKELEIISAIATQQIDIVLQPDPSAVDFQVADAAVPAKARKNVKHGLRALKSGNLTDAGKHLDAAYKVAPANPQIDFLMGYLFYQRRDLGRAQNFLAAATSLDPGDVQALTLLGRVGLQQEDYVGATSYLEKAIAADSGYWRAHDLLAGAYLKQQRFQDARTQAEMALDQSKGASNSSKLVLGQALVDLGEKQKGIEQLKAFVESSPKSATVPQVKDLIAQLEAPEAAPTVAAKPEVKAPAIDPLSATPDPVVSIKPWQPLGIDEMKPEVAAGVSCPVDHILQMTGKRMEEFVDNVSRIAAIEHLLHEQLDELGTPMTKQTRDFNYVAAFSEDKPGYLGIEEYRSEHLGLESYPDHIASSGFAGLALVFHPILSGNFDMTCEGLGELHGQATWLVHFRQRDDRPARLHDYRVGNNYYSARLKGRAWITADKFQIVRIESELVSAIPQIQLRSEHQIVEYGSVEFQKKNLELWLPKTAEIYFDFRSHRYYRRHSFDHYMLFAVDSTEKRKEPQAKVEPPQS
ncbi:MAG TPA: tetratricopeptide repeat protein [Verrucomicrobiae bacterium]|nr:tetratricopeptide repeat protein [Verrucomicrobiae bacterium]